MENRATTYQVVQPGAEGGGRRGRLPISIEGGDEAGEGRIAIRVELDGLVRRTAEEMGGDFYGVADLSTVQEAIVDQGGSMMAGFPRAVSTGIVQPDSVVW